jgi:hypothetical protein
MPFRQPTNWPMISGRSGLPKLRLSVIASGGADRGDVAPGFGHRLLAALERIGLAIARRHVGGQRQPLRAVLTRTTAASPPGRCTVLPRMTWSYCSQTQRLEQRSGEPISFSAARARDVHRRFTSRRDHRQLGGVGHVRPVVERRLVAKLLDRQVGHDVAPCFTTKRLSAWCSRPRRNRAPICGRSPRPRPPSRA